MRFATTSEIDAWDDAIAANPDGGNIFQGRDFAEQKQHGGWTPRYLVIRDMHCMALEKSVPLLGKLWYMPKGPGATTMRQLDDVLAELRTFAAKNGVFAVKIEPELRRENETVADLMKLGLVKTAPIQPNFSTILIDLRPSTDDILRGLNQKGRHAIKRAERDGAWAKQVEPTDENCHAMYELLAKTAEGSFHIRPYAYYKAFWQRFAKSSHGQLFFAYDPSERLIAGAYALVLGHKSTYKDGASVRDRTVYGASHLLQWEVIQWAKQRGSLQHDLCGAPPSDQINNPDHPHYGIGRFKTSFNKEVTDYVGAWDVVVDEHRYTLWKRIGEKLARKWCAVRYGESYY